MIATLVGGFVAILVGVSLIGPISTQVTSITVSANGSGTTCTSITQAGCANSALYLTSSWGATVLNLVPGFFALGILGIGMAVTYSSLAQAGIL